MDPVTGPGLPAHATASVFLLTLDLERPPRLALIRHPRYTRWMIPGGHVEPDETPAAAAVREVHEETGLAPQLLTPALSATALTDAPPGVAAAARPWWTDRQHVGAEQRLPHPHIHIDHLYVATTHGTATASAGELDVRWVTAADLPALNLFPGTRQYARQLLTGTTLNCLPGVTTERLS